MTSEWVAKTSHEERLRQRIAELESGIEGLRMFARAVLETATCEATLRHALESIAEWDESCLPHPKSEESE